MNLDEISPNYLADENSRKRKIIQLNDDENIPSDDSESIPGFCQEIIDEISDNGIMTTTQLNNIFLTPEFVHIFLSELSNMDYNLENEYEMVESCLIKIKTNPEFTEFLRCCLIPNCHTDEITTLVSAECLKNINNPNYSMLFSSYVANHPSEDMWPFILRMDEGYENPAMHLLFEEIFPKNKKDVIKKIKEIPTKEDMNILNMLQLTKDEFIEEKIFQYLLNKLRISCFYQGDGKKDIEDANQKDIEDSIMREIFTFIGRKMIEFDTFQEEFFNIAFNLIIESGDLYQMQISVKFLYNIIQVVPNEIISSMIENEFIPRIIDLLHTFDSTFSVIDSIVKLLLICLENFLDETLSCLDFDYLMESLEPIAEKYEDLQDDVDRIFAIIQDNTEE